MQACSSRILIIGGGAGGIELAVHLASTGYDNVRLIDRNDTHIWRPAGFAFAGKGTLLSSSGAGCVGAVRGWLGDDLEIRGRLARAAYRDMQRQHQLLLLGGAAGPRMKVY